MSPGGIPFLVNLTSSGLWLGAFRGQTCLHQGARARWSLGVERVHQGEGGWTCLGLLRLYRPFLLVPRKQLFLMPAAKPQGCRSVAGTLHQHEERTGSTFWQELELTQEKACTRDWENVAQLATKSHRHPVEEPPQVPELLC